MRGLFDDETAAYARADARMKLNQPLGAEGIVGDCQARHPGVALGLADVLNLPPRGVSVSEDEETKGTP